MHSILISAVTYSNGSILSALGQLNQFLPMAMILGVIYQIRKSGGTSSMNLIVLVSGSAIFAGGLISFSKQGMFTPMSCWLIAAASQRYKALSTQVIGFILTATFMVYFLVPYSQYGRSFIITEHSCSGVTRRAKQIFYSRT